MHPKTEAVLKLLAQADENQEKLLPALCLILEIYDNEPTALDPVVRALVPNVIRPLVKKVELRLGVPVFDDDVEVA